MCVRVHGCTRACVRMGACVCECVCVCCVGVCVGVGERERVCVCVCVCVCVFNINGIQDEVLLMSLFCTYCTSTISFISSIILRYYPGIQIKQ